MRWTSSSSERVDAAEAVQEAIARLVERHEEDVPDLVLCFTSDFGRDACEVINDHLTDAFPRATIVGATAESIVASDHEIEGRGAISLMAATLPGVRVDAFHITQEAVSSEIPWSRTLLPEPEEEPMLILLADPFSIDVKEVLQQVEASHPGMPVVGGFASFAARPLDNVLFMNGELPTSGAVGLSLVGNLRADFVVSQGCRPVGEAFIVTEGDGNTIRKLRGRTALEVLRDTVMSLDDDDRRLAENGLLIGRAIDEYRSDFGRGDFLIQGLLGASPEEGHIAVAGEVRRGQTVQFQVRDAAAADEDLRMLCELLDEDYAGAVLFTCNGRGTRMWKEPHHDVTVFQERFGPLPVAGFFAAGEIGPIGGRNFVHGFTVSAALFRPVS